MRSTKGTGWKKPDGPEWYILGRDQSKYMPDWDNAAPSRRALEKHEDPRTRKLVSRVSQHHACPRCGRRILDRRGVVIDLGESGKQLQCQARVAVDLETGAHVNQITVNLAEYKHGQVVSSKGRKYMVRVCGEPLWQYVGTYMRWAPADYVRDHMKGFFTYLIADELHEAKSSDAIQAQAMAKLMGSARYTLGLTGTLIGGYANHVFPLLFRMQADAMIDEGFRWGKQLGFNRKYGRIEKVVTTKKQPGGKSKASTHERPAPGIMPALFGRHLLDKSIFLSLDELASNLPRLREYVGGGIEEDYNEEDRKFHVDCRIEMSDDLREEYERVEQILVETNEALLQEGNNTLIGSMLQCLLGYADRPWDWGPVCFKEGAMRISAVEPDDLPRDVIYPKEQAYLDMIEREVGAGNQVWTYCQMTRTRDVQVRLKELLEARGIRVAILRSQSVKPKDRLGWIDKVGKDVDVIISHPQLVQTGLEFFNKARTHNFSSIAFYQTGFNPFHMRQAARRAWRIGQEKECRVYYFYYAGTAQHGAMKLMARKAAASLALDGRMTADGFAAMADDESAAMALAKSLSRTIKEDDNVQRLWTKVGGARVELPRTPRPARVIAPAVATLKRSSNQAVRDFLQD
jgi:hypothetical protein